MGALEIPLQMRGLGQPCWLQSWLQTKKSNKAGAFAGSTSSKFCKQLPNASGRGSEQWKVHHNIDGLFYTQLKKYFWFLPVGSAKD